MADKQPTDAHKTSGGETFPTSDLPGTDHPNPGQTDQHGVKGMEPASKTGTPAESKPTATDKP